MQDRLDKSHSTSAEVPLKSLPAARINELAGSNEPAIIIWQFKGGHVHPETVDFFSMVPEEVSVPLNLTETETQTEIYRIFSHGGTRGAVVPFSVNLFASRADPGFPVGGGHQLSWGGGGGASIQLCQI